MKLDTINDSASQADDQESHSQLKEMKEGDYLR